MFPRVITYERGEPINEDLPVAHQVSCCFYLFQLNYQKDHDNFI